MLRLKKPKPVPLHRVMECIQTISSTCEPASASGWADLNPPARMLRLGFDQTSNASRPVKWGCDPFVNERDRFLTYTHGLGGPCYG